MVYAYAFLIPLFPLSYVLAKLSIFLKHLIHLAFFITVDNIVLTQPQFGASLQILKVEIGGDVQSTGMYLSHTICSVNSLVSKLLTTTPSAQRNM